MTRRWEGARWRGVAAAGAAAVVLVAATGHGLPLCAYRPPESRFAELQGTGHVQWRDGPYRDDREASLSGMLQANALSVFDSEELGYRVDASANALWDGSQRDVRIRATGELKRYLAADRFGLASLAARFGGLADVEVDVTVGIGLGRFRDVTPLSRALAVHDALLDEGVLVAPLPDEALLDLGQILGELGVEDLVVAERVAAHFVGAGVVADGAVGPVGLLRIGQLLEAPLAPRLCGWEVHASLGGAIGRDDSDALDGAWAVVGRVAFVPDRVSQITATTRFTGGVRAPVGATAEVSVVAARRLAVGWEARAVYEGQFLATVAEGAAPRFVHDLSLVLGAQVSSRLGVAFTGSIGFREGDQEVTTDLALNLSYALR